MKKSKEKITNVPQVQTIRKQINVPVIYRTNDEGKIVYDYGAMHDIFEEEMSKLDTKQYSETSR